MQMRNHAILSLRLAALALIAVASALPTFDPSPLKPRATVEIWSIPRMELHMMTRHSGLPGDGGWPESEKYPSSMDFELNMPNNKHAYCQVTFMNGTLPDDVAACTSDEDASDEGGVRFTMSEYTALGQRRKELSFVLQVFRVTNIAGQQAITTGEVAITANTPKEPTSYLTCLLGAPFDGLRCKLHGMMSNHRELKIVAHSSTSSNTSVPATAS